MKNKKINCLKVPISFNKMVFKKPGKILIAKSGSNTFTIIKDYFKPITKFY